MTRLRKPTGPKLLSSTGSEPPISAEHTIPSRAISGVHGPPIAVHARDRRPATLEEVTSAMMIVSRAVRLEMRDEEIVDAYMEALRGLLPGRFLAIRLLDEGTMEVTLVYASGKLRPDRRERIVVSRDALAYQGLPAPEVRGAIVGAGLAYEPIFEGAAGGFDALLAAGDYAAGSLSVEYPDSGSNVVAEDRAVAVAFATQLAATLRQVRALRDSTYLRDYLAQMLENANAPIAVIGRDRSIRVVNRSLLGLVGLRREAVVGRDFLTLLPSEEQGRLAPYFFAALRGETTGGVEVELARDGNPKRLAVSIAGIAAANGEVDSCVAVGHDITQVVALQRQVIQAEKLATLGQLAAGVVHELNNPLTSISAYADYLLRTATKRGDAPSDVEKLRRIVEAAERILHFTQDLVAYARPTTENPRPLPINEVLDQAVTFCDHVVAECGAVVERDYATSLPTVSGVRSQLQQVFINLITNACHAMPAGAGRLRITTSLLGRRVLIRISDNGSGIREADLERIFEPFFSTKGEGKGTGLGLSIVRNILQQHQADISVDSPPGQGTTFLVRLSIVD